MSTAPADGQISLPNASNSRRHDISYRTGLVVQVLGAAVLAVLYPLQSPFYTIGIMLFDAGVLLSAVYLSVRMPWVRRVIVGSVIIGICLQIGGFYLPEEQVGRALLAGIGFVCAGAAGMAGKEAYCFGYREGWLLMLFGFPFVILANLLGKEDRIVNSLGFSVLFLLLLSLTGKKVRQRLPAPSTTTMCGLTPGQSD